MFTILVQIFLANLSWLKTTFFSSSSKTAYFNTPQTQILCFKKKQTHQICKMTWQCQIPEVTGSIDNQNILINRLLFQFSWLNMDLRAQDATQSGRASYYYYIRMEISTFSLVSISAPLYYINMVYLHPNGIYYTATTEPHSSFSVM